MFKKKIQKVSDEFIINLFNKNIEIANIYYFMTGISKRLEYNILSREYHFIVIDGTGRMDVTIQTMTEAVNRYNEFLGN